MEAPQPSAATCRLHKGFKWSADKRQWLRPGVRVPKGVDGVPAFCCVQLSPSSIATCRICGKLIPRKEFRFAWPLSDPRGIYGAIPAWIHAECANVLLPQLFAKWQIQERLGWPDYQLGDDDDDDDDDSQEAGGGGLSEGRMSKSQDDASGDGGEEGETEDLTTAMTLEVWLELYCAGWLELTPEEKATLIAQVKAPVRINVQDESATRAQHVSLKLTPVEHVPGMSCTLLRFQKEGIAWMIHQEGNEKAFGGILADEMGMGKTIQTIGCILSNRVYGTNHPTRLAQGELYVYPAAHPRSELNQRRRVKLEEAKERLEREIADGALAEAAADAAAQSPPPPTPSPGTARASTEKPREKTEPIKTESADASDDQQPSQKPKRQRKPRKVREPREPRTQAKPKAAPRARAPKAVTTYRPTRETAAADVSAMETSDKCRIDEAPEITKEGATLVIAPLAAVLQWQSELGKFAPDLNVMVYHGANRALLTDELELADVVITTYPTLEADYRAIVTKHKLRCQYCGRMFLPSKLRLHLRDMCGPDAVRTARQQLRERKQEQTKRKAMETLQIGEPADHAAASPESTVPTIANIYREIMHAAGRHAEAENFSAAPWLRPVRRQPAVGGGSEDSGGDADREDPTTDAARNAELEEDGEHGAIFPDSFCSPRLFRDASRYSDDSEDDREAEMLRVDKILTPNLNARQLHREPDYLRATPQLSPTASPPPPESESEPPPELSLELTTASEIQPPLEPAIPSGAEGIGSPDNEELESSLRISAKAPPVDPPPWAEPPANAEAASVSQVEPAPSSPMADEAAAAHDTVVPSPVSPPEQPKNYEEWARNASESQVKKSRVDLLRVVLAALGVEEAKTLTKKADLVQALLSWREGEVRSPQSLARGKPETPPAKVKRPRRAATRTEEIVRTVSAAAAALDSSDESSILTEDETSSDDVDMSVPTSDDESMSGVVVPDEEASSPAEASPPTSDISIASSPPASKGFRGWGKKSKKGGKGGKLSASVMTSNNASTSGGSNALDLNFIDLSLSPLHAVKWNRIVLDEAHRIKSHTTNTCKSVFALKSCGTRWCLTGTPLQNRIHELYSLLRFLQFFPYAYYFCSKRDCNCSTLNYAFEAGSYCVTCGHTKMTHFSYFNRKVAKPIITYGAHGEGGLALETLRRDVLSVILLRRTKVERAEDVNLPPLDVFIRKEELSQPEMDFYESLYKQSKTKFDTYTLAGTILHNFAHVFDLLSRLRQAVDHPYMIVHGSLATKNEDLIPSNSHSTNDICGICQEDIEQNTYYRSTCDHHFDTACLDTYVQEAPDNTLLGCPVCYQSLTYTLFSKTTGKPVVAGEVSEDPDEDNLRSNPVVTKSKSTIMSRINPKQFQSSTKIEVLVQEISSSAPDSKAIVFSQFTSFLYLIEFRLKREGFKCAVFTGSLSMESRQNIILNFNSDPDLKVILISLKAGGEGLNLQIANQIYLMDPWWNPAAEMQAIQRAHRIGQTKPVRAVRIIAKNTIEERILQLQQKKQLVFDGTVNNSNQAFQKLSADDLKFLFQ